MTGRCEFGLCTRPAEFSVTVRDDITPIRVCPWHVTPVVSWGVPEPIPPTGVRYLPVAS